jgi:hypothetical protein
VRFSLADPDLDYLIYAVQRGVVARWQLLERGATDNDIERLLRRRELVQAHPGVYVTHNARLTRQQREWVAVLSAWPAALTLESAVPDEASRTVDIAVAVGRKVVVPRWARAVRIADFTDRVDWHAEPPRVQIEHATIDLMSQRIASGDVPGAFAALARSVHSRRTSPAAILRVLSSRKRVTGRKLIAGLLADARDGACSVLERAYLREVERAHDLPRGTRQHATAATGKISVKDVLYEEFGLIVELDGRAFHDRPGAWDSDAERDLAELATRDARTARVTYGLVFGDPCRTATWIGRILQRLGWRGEVRPCPRCAHWRRTAA